MREIKNIFEGKEYWRNLDQFADTPELKQLLEKEFPDNAEDISDPVSRRKFLGLMSASLAFAGLASCRRPVEKIVPYVQAPENIVPGVPKYFATTATRGAEAYGMLVESHEGRPTKIEGNESILHHWANPIPGYSPRFLTCMTRTGQKGLHAMVLM